MLSLSLPEFAEQLGQGGGRIALWNDGTAFKASTAQWQPLADQISKLSDFKNHEAAFIFLGPKSRQLHSAWIHRTSRGPGAGGVRRKSYPSVSDWVTDGLRLAVGMGYKNALAGLWWGGGKAVIGRTCKEEDLAVVYSEFGDFMSELSGCYITAEDMGTKPQNMATVFSRTRFTTCIPARFGGSGNPSPATARGLFVGIEAVLRHLGKTTENSTIAIQGLGEVGSRLAEHLHHAGANLIVFDPDQEKLAATLALDKRHRASSEESILLEKADVTAPCAMGAVLNPDTIGRMQCKAVCGAANNQLSEDDRDSEALHHRGILYIPDFLVNRMGIVNCADEQYGRLQPDPAIERHLGWEWEHAIGPVVLKLLTQSEETGNPPLQEAAKRAEELMDQHHPIWPNRSRQIARAVWEEFGARACPSARRV